MPGKIQALKRHAKKRARQRYRIQLSNADLRALAHKIRRSNGTFVQRHSNRVTEWNVTHDGIPVRVLYDKDRKSIITCLPQYDRR